MHQFKQQERGMAFIEVIGGKMVVAERTQRTHASDAQYDLLTNTHIAIHTIEALRYLVIAVDMIVANIGVEQIEPDAPDIGARDLRVSLTVAQRSRDMQRPSSGA